MNALEQLNRQNQDTPRVGKKTPFQPDTHQGFDTLLLFCLPADEERPSGTRWTPTGFEISGPTEFVRGVLKDRFFHNPAVGYTFRLSDNSVVEYEYQPVGVRVEGATYQDSINHGHIAQSRC